MVNMQKIGETIKALREGAGYNQQSIATFLKVDQSLISKIEKGERNIASDMLEKLASKGSLFSLLGINLWSAYYVDSNPLQASIRHLRQNNLQWKKHPQEELKTD